MISENNEKAKYLFSSRAFWKIKRNFGQLDSLSSPQESLFNIKQNGWESEFEKLFFNSIVGSKKIVKEKLNDLNKTIKSDEITILTWCFDEKERIYSYKIFFYSDRIEALSALMFSGCFRVMPLQLLH